MRIVTYNEYLRYIKDKKYVEIGGKRIKLTPIKIERLTPLPEEFSFSDIFSTVWSFPKRGIWGTHRPIYRGNWAPQIPRALLLLYTKPADKILDPMMGGGTTLIEAKLLGRNAIGVDINYNAVILTLHNLYYLEKKIHELKKQGTKSIGEIDIDTILKTNVEVYHGDVRELTEIKDNSIDAIFTHPPYFKIIKYSKRQRVITGDLSLTKNLTDFLNHIKLVTEEFYRVLKKNGVCAILIGDTRKHKHYVPISHYILNIFVNTGFKLKEEIIKIQHNVESIRTKWRPNIRRDFLLIMHEKLFVFQK